MSVAEGSRERVEERLLALEEGYSGFPVNQTTLAVPRGAYERASERCQRGIVDVYVQLENDDGDVLLVQSDDEWVVPHGEPRASERVVAGTERIIQERTGVDCEITGVRRVTILGIRDEDDPDRPPVYRLVAVFTAEPARDGDSLPADPPIGADDDVRWESTLPDSAVPSH